MANREKYANKGKIGKIGVKSGRTENSFVKRNNYVDIFYCPARARKCCAIHTI